MQPLSVDEAFLDATGTDRIYGPAVNVARNLKKRIFDQLHLTASVGVAPNKFLAKLASDLHKPDGLTVIGAEDVERVLPPLPVTRIWGIGPKTAKRLQEMGIHTIGDLQRAPDVTLKLLLGDDSERCHRLAHGLDDRPVETDADARQISQEQTFRIDVANPDIVRDELLEQVQHVARRLRKHALRTGGVTLKIRYGQFQTITRSRMLDEPTDQTDALWNLSRSIFNDWARRSFQPIRLIGMAARNLTREPGQMILFADPASARHQRTRPRGGCDRRSLRDQRRPTRNRQQQNEPVNGRTQCGRQPGSHPTIPNATAYPIAAPARISLGQCASSRYRNSAQITANPHSVAAASG